MPIEVNVSEEMLTYNVKRCENGNCLGSHRSLGPKVMTLNCPRHVSL